jgi:hypothetical protein
VYEILGFGKPPEFSAFAATPGVFTFGWGPVLHQLAAGLGVKIDNVEETNERIPAPESFDTPTGHIDAGTIAAMRSTLTGYVGDKPTFVIDHVTRMRDDIAPDWPQPHICIPPKDTGYGPASGRGLYRVEIEGSPSMRCEFEMADDHDHDLGARIAGASRMVNAIPAVCAAPPGLLSALDLSGCGYRRGRFPSRAAPARAPAVEPAREPSGKQADCDTDVRALPEHQPGQHGGGCGNRGEQHRHRRCAVNIDGAHVQADRDRGIEQHDGADRDGGFDRVVHGERREGREHRRWNECHSILHRAHRAEVNARAITLLVHAADRKTKQRNNKQRDNRVESVCGQKPGGACGEHRDDAEGQRNCPLQAERLAQERRGQDRGGDGIHRDHHRTQHRGCPEPNRLIEGAELHGLDE